VLKRYNTTGKTVTATSLTTKSAGAGGVDRRILLEQIKNENVGMTPGKADYFVTKAMVVYTRKVSYKWRTIESDAQDTEATFFFFSFASSSSLFMLLSPFSPFPSCSRTTCCTRAARHATRSCYR
jgi:hypothetical protein